MDATDEKYWVPHPSLVWAPCISMGERGADAIFKDEHGQEVSCPATEFKDLDTVHLSQLQGAQNITSLEVVNKATVLHTVRVRYAQQDIYTHVGRILVAVNPFQPLSIYTKEWMEKYMTTPDPLAAAPHVYATCRDAFEGLKSRTRGQAVLVSGESGAGKTETTKLVLSYMSEALGQPVGPGAEPIARYALTLEGAEAQRPSIERRRSAFGVATSVRKRQSRYSVLAMIPDLSDKIIQTNPVLESFGNAMTVRNNNSSRFGKWVEIGVSQRLSIKGCSVTDYGLELTRVCKPGAKERNYHIFYQVLGARRANPELLRGLGTGRRMSSVHDFISGGSPLAAAAADAKDSYVPGSFAYLRDSLFQAPGVSDEKNFQELQQGFDALGFTANTQTEVFRIVIGILTLGNVEFQDGDGGATVPSEGPSAKAAELFCVDAEELRRSIVVRKINVAGDITETYRDPPKARSARDALARLLYGRLFKWLIAKINVTLSTGDGAVESDAFFGILDIAGFEMLEQNSLEQVFINLSNEFLQRFFNIFFFKSEQASYAEEGIEVNFDITYADNVDIIELIERPAGILSMLDEELSIPKASDQTYIAKVLKAHGKHPRLIAPKFSGTLQFGIRHFAGNVTYSCEGFLEKNDDKLPDDAVECLRKSELTVLQEIAEAVSAEVKESSGQRGKKVQTVSVKFRKSLASLMDKLNTAQPHFIRCVKPNPDKRPFQFVSSMVQEQLVYSGVMEAVRIWQLGYSTRLPFDEFVRHFECLVDPGFEKLDGPQSVERSREVATRFKSALFEVGGAKIGSQAVDFADELDPAMEDTAIKIGKTKVFVNSKAGSLLERRRIFYGHRKREIEAASIEGLRAAVQSRKIEALEEFINKCEDLELVPREVASAREVLEVERRKAECRVALAEACEARDGQLLDSALGLAAELGLEGAEVAAAKVARATLRLEAALRDGGVEALRAAAAEAEASGVDGADPVLREVRRQVDEQARKEAARRGIEQAARTLDAAVLEAALAEGRAAGLEEEELGAAQHLLEEERRRAAARAALAAAAAGRAESALEAALAEGEAAGLGEGCPELQAARGALAEERAGRARAQLREAEAGGGAEELRAAIAFGEAAGLGAPELGAPRALAQLVEALAEGGQGPLRAAVAAALAAGVEHARLEGAKALLASQEQREEALASLAEGLAARSPARLREGIARGEALGLGEPQLAAARAALREEEQKAETIAALEEATAARDLEALRCAVAAAGEARAGAEPGLGLDVRPALEGARRVLEEEELARAAREELDRALAEGSPASLQAALEAGEAAGLPPEDLRSARAALVLLEAKAACAESLREAARQEDEAALRAAIAKATELGLDGKDLEAAQRALQQVELRRACLQRLQEALQQQCTAGVRAAVAACRAAGVGEARLQAAQDQLRRAARANLDEALGGDAAAPSATGGHSTALGEASALLSAIMEAVGAGLDQADLEAAKGVFWGRVRKATEEGDGRYLAVRDELLSQPSELAFEVMRLGLQSEGPGALDAKFGEAACLCTEAAGRQFARRVEKEWHGADGTILDELCRELRACSVSLSGTAAGSRAPDARLLYRYCAELKSLYGASLADERLSQFPLALLCMLLYTQHDVDVDRLLLFQDCPPACESPGGRGAAYGAYRERHRSRRSGDRNEAVCAAAALSATLGEEGSPPARWIKLSCLLSAARIPLSPPRQVSRWLCGLPAHLVAELGQRRPGERLCWAQLGSCTLDGAIAEGYWSAAGPEEGVLLTVEGVTEGLELAALSQYPAERELVLPACSLLRVRQATAPDGRPPHLRCEYAGTLLSDELQEACWYDLAKASFGLQLVLDEVRPSKGPPSPPTPPPAPQRQPARAQSPRLAGQLSPQAAPSRMRTAAAAAHAAAAMRRAGAPGPGQPGGLAPSPGLSSVYSEEAFRTLGYLFGQMDRRGAFALSRDDFVAAQTKLRSQPEFARLLKNSRLCAQFFECPHDLTLHRFLFLAMPCARESDVRRALRWAAGYVKRRSGQIPDSPREGAFQWPDSGTGPPRARSPAAAAAAAGPPSASRTLLAAAVARSAAAPQRGSPRGLRPSAGPGSPDGRANAGAAAPSAAAARPSAARASRSPEPHRLSAVRGGGAALARGLAKRPSFVAGSRSSARPSGASSPSPRGPLQDRAVGAARSGTLR